MANKKISDLPLTAAVNSDDTFEKSDHNAAPSQRVTFSQLASALGITVGVKVYRALLNQTAGNDPVATVLENSFGEEIVWTRAFAGQYAGTLAGAFTSNKTWLNIAQTSTDGLVQNGIGCDISRIDANTIKIDTGSVGVATSDGQLLNTSVEVLVYP